MQPRFPEEISEYIMDHIVGNTEANDDPGIEQGRILNGLT